MGAERIIIKVSKYKNIGAALKAWKVKNYQISKDIRSRKAYSKPSKIKREAKKKADYGYKFRKENGL